MTASFVQVAVDGSGKKLATDSVVEGGSEVHRTRVVVDAATLPVGAATEATAAAFLAKLTDDPATATGQAALGNLLATQAGYLDGIEPGLASILAKVSSDPATQTTLAALLAKTSSDPATNSGLASIAGLLTTQAGYLDGIEAGLASILAKQSADPATQATLAAVLAMLIAAPATEAKQDAQTLVVGAVTETPPANDTASSGLNGRLQRIAQRLTALIGQLPASLGIKTATASLSVAPASDAVFSTVSSALVRSVLLNAITVTGAGSALADSGRPPSFSADLTGTGSISATVLVQGRNVASGLWVLLGTITLSGTASASDGFASLTRYMEYRANCTAISGTSATLTVAMGS